MLNQMRKRFERDLIRVARGEMRRRNDLESCSTHGRACTQESIVTEVRSNYSCDLQPSVWDAALFLGVSCFRVHDHFFLCVAFIVNVILQSLFCLVVVHLGTEFDAVEGVDVKRLEIWLERALPAGVSSVCGPSLDLSLSSSHLQMILVVQVRGYFAKTVFGFSWGPLLTVMVIALWSAVMVRHARSLVDLMVALCTLTEWRSCTESMRFTMNLTTVEIQTISPARLLWMMLVIVAQFGVIAVLLVCGCLWIVESSTVQELFLNAVSLAFILDTDELVFVTIVPTIIATFVSKSESLALPSKPSRVLSLHFRSMMSLITIVVFGILFEVLCVEARSQRMREVREAACGG